MITPTKRAAVADEHRAHLGPRQRLPGLLRASRRPRARAGRRPSRRGRAARLASRVDPPRLERRRDARGSRRPAPRCAARRRRCSESAQTRSNASPSFSASRAPDLVAVPEQAAQVLHPLEVRDGDAAGVREHVGQDRDPARGEDRVGRDRGRAVRALDDEPAASAPAFASVTWSSRAASTSTSQSSSSSSAFESARRREALRASRARARTRAASARRARPGRSTPPETSRDGDHGRALLVQLGRRDPADVAEALDDAAQLGEVPAEPLAGALDHHHDARRRSPRGGRASRRSRSACR